MDPSDAYREGEGCDGMGGGWVGVDSVVQCNAYHSQGCALVDGDVLGRKQARFGQHGGEDRCKEVMAKRQKHDVVEGIFGDNVLVQDDDSHPGYRV
jgi:hypothetical protein